MPSGCRVAWAVAGHIYLGPLGACGRGRERSARTGARIRMGVIMPSSRHRAQHARYNQQGPRASCKKMLEYSRCDPTIANHNADQSTINDNSDAHCLSHCTTNFALRSRGEAKEATGLKEPLGGVVLGCGRSIGTHPHEAHPPSVGAHDEANASRISSLIGPAGRRPPA
jgi:hypothetical protein